jgi:hypothetical protein
MQMTEERVRSSAEEHTEQGPADADARQHVVVGILADPDLPASIARRFPTRPGRSRSG